MTALGPIVDAAGVDITLNEGDLVTGCVVLSKIVDADGAVRLAVSWSEGMSWLERIGMLRFAEISEREDVADA